MGCLSITEVPLELSLPVQIYTHECKLQRSIVLFSLQGFEVLRLETQALKLQPFFAYYTN